MTYVKRHLLTGETPFKCGFCEKTFKTKFKLTCHKQAHNGENPYNCGFCQKTFAHLAGFNTHKYSHTGKNSIKSFQCNLCEKAFA